MLTRLAEYLTQLNMKCNNNKQCAGFDLGTAPWTSIYIIMASTLECYKVVKYL